MTTTDTVTWLKREMQGAIRCSYPLVGCSDWPNPADADPPELRRALGEDDLRRAMDLADRRGIMKTQIFAVWNAAAPACSAREDKAWIAGFIDMLDNLAPGDQPVRSSRP